MIRVTYYVYWIVIQHGFEETYVSIKVHEYNSIVVTIQS